MENPNEPIENSESESEIQPQQNSTLNDEPMTNTQPQKDNSCEKEKCPGDGLFEEFKKIYFYSNKGKEEDRKKGEGEDYIEKRTVLMDMAKSYRTMIEMENKLYNDRTLWFIHCNGFLIAALGLMLANNKDINPLLMIFITLVFTFFGCILAQKFSREIIKGRHGSWYLRERWRCFLREFFGYQKDKHINLTRDFYIPPITGLSEADHEAFELLDEKEKQKNPELGQDQKNWVTLCKKEKFTKCSVPVFNSIFESIEKKWMYLGGIVTVLQDKINDVRGNA